MSDVLQLDDGTRLPVMWLRDMCGCAGCVHPSGQRLLDPATIPTDLSVGGWTLADGTLRVQWEPEGHLSEYDLAELLHEPQRRMFDLWDASAAPQLPTVTHAAVTAQGTGGRVAMRDWLRGVDRMGCGLLRGVPVADGEVARVAELFAQVRVTNYGRWFDVRAVVDPTNLADTSLGLPPHTDNPYRDPVPTMQLLHCLQSSAEGGDNVLVDGWHVAGMVRAADPEGFAMLASTAVTFRYSDTEAHLTTTLPIVELDDDRTDWAVRGVRFNARSMQPPRLSADRSVAWYRGYTLFARLLADPANQIHLHLEPGDLFIVDNRRVLHGRTVYESNADGTTGARHLQGCYADIDGLRSTLAVLEREAIVSAVVDEIARLFHTKGSRAYLGEPVSISEHMLQTAHVAELEGAPPALVVAALLHDVGHLVHDMDDDSADHGIDTVHEEAGARWLAPHFGPEVTEPVRLHVAAKRYLCATDPTYLAVLSPASVHSLHLQGGPFSPAEAAAYAALPFALDGVAVRRWDDTGKLPGQQVPGFEHFRPLLETCRRGPAA